MTSFPILLRLQGRTCLVWIRERAQSGKLAWRRRAFSARDLRGAFLVVAATNSAASNCAVFRACRARGVFCNVVDDPEHCDFFYPAVMRRGRLQIAISTEGNSPALAARLRQELELQFGPEWGPFVEHIGKLRQRFLSAGMPLDKKRDRLAEIAGHKAFLSFRRQWTRATRRRI
jgi:precorrin-2 dehydrogenase/sirohydrochlorin ferrochelatase